MKRGDMFIEREATAEGGGYWKVSLVGAVSLESG
jgi:hypothetical protein